MYLTIYTLYTKYVQQHLIHPKVPKVYTYYMHSFLFGAQVFSGCGRPRLGKRSNVATELHFETLQFGRNNRNRGMAQIDPTALERLIGDASYKVII
jgi:hypothetical protein